MARGNLTKAAIVEEVARASDLTRSRAEVVVRAVFGSMVKAMRRGEEIELRGFGSFRLRRRESRTGRNPKTGGQRGRAAQAHPLLQARQRVDGTDQPGVGSGRNFTVVWVGPAVWAPAVKSAPGAVEADKPCLRACGWVESASPPACERRSSADSRLTRRRVADASIASAVEHGDLDTHAVARSLTDAEFTPTSADALR